MAPVTDAVRAHYARRPLCRTFRMLKPPSAHPGPLPTTEAHILMRPGGSVHDLAFDVQAQVPSHLRRPQLRQSDIHARFTLLPYLLAQHRITVLLEAIEEVKQRLAV